MTDKNTNTVPNSSYEIATNKQTQSCMEPIAYHHKQLSLIEVLIEVSS